MDAAEADSMPQCQENPAQVERSSKQFVQDVSQIHGQNLRRTNDLGDCNYNSTNQSFPIHFLNMATVTATALTSQKDKQLAREKFKDQVKQSFKDKLKTAGQLKHILDAVHNESTVSRGHYSRRQTDAGGSPLDRNSNKGSLMQFEISRQRQSFDPSMASLSFLKNL